mmetsp:Transcript_70204/g.182105  ORF Transcript_70204/g.182105 Transcript_70204/m.182105 type:complete len:206 (-) Transcript_70204:575-1192(-)
MARPGPAWLGARPGETCAPEGGNSSPSSSSSSSSSSSNRNSALHSSSLASPSTSASSRATFPPAPSPPPPPLCEAKSAAEARWSPLACAIVRLSNEFLIAPFPSRAEDTEECAEQPSSSSTTSSSEPPEAHDSSSSSSPSEGASISSRSGTPTGSAIMGRPRSSISAIFAPPRPCPPAPTFRVPALAIADSCCRVNGARLLPPLI